MSEPAPPLELAGVTKRYENGGEIVEALVDVDLSIEAGEFLAVVGPSGSGKSTMLNVLGLLDAPSEGVVRLHGRDVTTLSDVELTDARRTAIGFVFQDFHLVPTLTAAENVELPTLFARDPEGMTRARDLLERVDLGGRLDHRPKQLSGGQQQRVAIARALVNEPAVVLADEPTGNLDRETGRAVLEELRGICDEGVAVVAVTHDPLVTEYTDRVVELVDGHLREVASGERTVAGTSQADVGGTVADGEAGGEP
ncbi:ABC transporter ATP-binding protein [Salinigranum halophilum]|jgi:putative ABC transport system ATP-binding protein|uniref:ABC transporter ATP-binding protein n=1 Tax=Salinigranum halophilum TaxID=2565931 RepID=UPI0010A7CF68|nr:ABC transporter ATP-binding protein [Salinigranum halophilum]